MGKTKRDKIVEILVGSQCGGDRCDYYTNGADSNPRCAKCPYLNTMHCKAEYMVDELVEEGIIKIKKHKICECYRERDGVCCYNMDGENYACLGDERKCYYKEERKK